MITRSVTEGSKPAAHSDNIAAIAGRGTIYITAAKLWFVVSGYCITVALAHLLSDADYGVYRVVINVVSIINAVIVTGTYQTVSKYVSQEPRNAGAVKSKALALQGWIGSAASFGFFLLAPLVAGLLNDSRLTNYLRLASLITLAYSFYSVYTGYFNGQRRFSIQAGLDIFYSTAKLIFIVALAAFGFGVAGSVGGFAIAAASVLAASAIIGRGGAREGEVRATQLLRFQSYLLALTFLLTLLQRVDLMLIKSLSSSDATAASENAAHYGAAVDVANITYQIIVSVTFVIFPLISKSAFEDDRARTQVYVSNTLRYTLMIMALTATLFSANASGVLRVIFRESYQSGSRALGVVAFGVLFFGLLYVITTIISASGRPLVSLLIAATTLIASAVLNALMIPRYGLVGAATATSISMFGGAVAGCAYVKVRFGALISPLSALRIVACAGLVYGASLLFSPASKVLVLTQLAGLCAVYVAALIVSREVGREDLNAISQVFKTK